MFMHTSLDGFVTDQDGGMRWIIMDEPVFQFVGKKISDEIGSALYGRVTYDMMEAYWPTAAQHPDASDQTKRHAQWYQRVDKIVLSTKLTTDDETVTVIPNNLVNRIKEQKSKPGKDIVIFGSPSTTHSLLEHDLIDGCWLFVNPVLLGKGTSLFSRVPQMMKLTLTEIHKFDSGVLFLNYERGGEER